MIWVINHASEYDATFPTFRYYREVLGRENVNIFCAKDGETFEFLKAEDVVLLRSGDKAMVETLIERQRVIGFKSTIEKIEVIEVAYNKAKIKNIILQAGIRTPKLITDDGQNRGKLPYFVKPMFGEDSKGVSLDSVCKTIGDVQRYKGLLQTQGFAPIVEEFIEGVDCTVAVIKDSSTGELRTYAIDIEVDNEHGVQTERVKNGTIAYCQPTSTPEVKDISKKAFEAIGAEHYMRIDFRITPKGEAYLIDLNIFPGFGIAGYMYRSLMLAANKSYRDFINEIIGSAS